MEIDKTRYLRSENTAALVVQLQRLLSGIEKFVLVFDGIDHQREAPATLLPALARFNEFVWATTSCVAMSLTMVTDSSADHRLYRYFST